MAVIEKIHLKKGAEKDIKAGYPWALQNDVITSSALLGLDGAVVELVTQRDEYVATAYYNSKSKIPCRVLTYNKAENIDEEFFTRRITQALNKRQKLFNENYYRLIHSESDNLPGLVADRFGDILVLQISTLGMEKLEKVIISAFEKLLKAEIIVLRNDIPARKYEGLKEEVRVVKGLLPKQVVVKENGVEYYADLLQGQKTGWFYDQRDNRQFMAELSKDKTVVDIFSHSGGFGILAAKLGAKNVTMIDASDFAIDLAKQSASHNKVDKICEFITADAFSAMQKLEDMGKKFEVVITDPPAFVKSRKDIMSGLKGYEKVARLAARITAKSGLLYIAACSHHAEKNKFIKAAQDGIKKAGRNFKIVKITGEARDHPLHPKLPQTGYLKSVIFQLD